MEKEKKSYGKSILVVLLLLITMVALVFATYAWARYTSTSTGNVTANIAKWDVAVKTDGTKFVKQYEHVVKDKIAPGTEGQIDISLMANETDVNFDFVVNLTDPSTMQKPKHVRFYKDAAHTKEIANSNDVIAGRVYVVDESTGAKLAKPQIAMATGVGTDGVPTGISSTRNDLDTTTGNLTIYWDWAYDYATFKSTDGGKTAGTCASCSDADTYDQEDTLDAYEFNGKTLDTDGNVVDYNSVSGHTGDSKQMVVDFTLTATQVKPIAK